MLWYSCVPLISAHQSNMCIISVVQPVCNIFNNILPFFQPIHIISVDSVMEMYIFSLSYHCKNAFNLCEVADFNLEPDSLRSPLTDYNYSIIERKSWIFNIYFRTFQCLLSISLESRYSKVAILNTSTFPKQSNYLKMLYLFMKMICETK